MAPAILTVLAFLLDKLIGDPQSWPHPVRWIGKLIDLLELLLRRLLAAVKAEGPGPALLAGGALYLLTVGVSAGAVEAALLLSYRHVQVSGVRILWLLVTLYLVFTSICLNDLLRHTARVEAHLSAGDLEGARKALSWIVGRDTAGLDAAAVRRAEIETLAENFSDGLAAPLFYLSLGGPLLAWIYKATNTLDSMVGYRNEKYLYLGRASARMDDALNFLPSRLAAFLLVTAAWLGGGDARGACRRWRREGRFHTSPNSGQTEAAMAGALGVFLGGPSVYGGRLVAKPTLGEGGRVAEASDVRKAERLVSLATLLSLLLCLGIQAVLWLTLNSHAGWGVLR
ncbi:MAG: adenosylcobinamide-phosphate synthase CbiB [Deltaproteobacteria bacterium]|jgi:adenosylcobinamide-phosphate synthase|nr:adenosylcobinamide-phosphate synthase CbiB [Deltaproteobacteria bacterium]